MKCPKCGGIMKNGVCPDCGYTAKGGSKKPAPSKKTPAKKGGKVPPQFVKKGSGY